MPELLLGCGADRRKKIKFPESPEAWTELVTADIDPACSPDIVLDLNQLPYPWADNHFDEVHAYEVLEHCGAQGDWRFFFAQFDELWRILKPGGYLVATTPMWDSPWAWGDPGHRRIISRESLIFLDRDEYAQVGKTAMTDYRAHFKCNFRLMGVTEENDTFGFVLRAIKPLA